MTASIPPLWAIGLMSGTSLDGIDAALLQTDGERIFAFGPSLTIPYEAALRERIRAVFGEKASPDEIARVERHVTERHIEATERLLEQSGTNRSSVSIVGFHGQTIAHCPERRYTRQIGDGAWLAKRLGCPVAFDFRSADVASGGQGAPLVPVYHRALAAELSFPLAILNIGGVANVTFLTSASTEPLAFDTGPGNALLNDWMFRHTGMPMDCDGTLARTGHVDNSCLQTLLSHPYFRKAPPKSLDRDTFSSLTSCLESLSVKDGAATLTAFTAECAVNAGQWAQTPPEHWLVCGGGRHNTTLMSQLNARAGAPVAAVETIGWNGDALEAQAFAFPRRPLSSWPADHLSRNHRSSDSTARRKNRVLRKNT